MEEKSILGFNWERNIKDSRVDYQPALFSNVNYNTLEKSREFYKKIRKCCKEGRKTENKDSELEKILKESTDNDGKTDETVSIISEFMSMTKQMPIAQADPNDLIILKSNAKAYYPCLYTWMNTIDTYLCHYYIYSDTVMQNNYDFEKNRLRTIFLPDAIVEKFNSAKGTDREQKEQYQYIKSFNIREKIIRNEKRELHAGDCLNKADEVNPIILQSFCKDITLRSDADKVRNSLEYNGLLFLAKDYVEFIPQFSLYHYIQHELMAHTSLAIEIAAIYLELEKLFADLGFPHHELENIYAFFVCNFLPIIVDSPYIFSGIAAGRLFFQQILLEINMNYYQGSAKQAAFLQSEKEWCSMLGHALSFRYAIPSRAKILDISLEKEKEALAELQKLIFDMKEPVNFSSIVTTGNRNLAVFCNPKHKNVKRFIDILNKRAKEGFPLVSKDEYVDKTGNFKKETPYGRKRNKEEDTFQKVHSDIMICKMIKSSDFAKRKTEEEPIVHAYTPSKA